MSNIKQYLSLFTHSFMRGILDKKALAGLSLFLLASLFIFTYIWKALSISPLSQEQLIWYVTLNHWVTFSLPDMQPQMKQDIQNKCFISLPQTHYLITTFLSAFGLFLARLLVLGLIAFVFIRTQVDQLPFSPSSLGLFVFLGIPAGIVALLFWIKVGLFAFFIKEVDLLYSLCKKLCFFLGGLILPLSFYPSWVHGLVSWTPFPIILGQRSSLILGYSPLDLTCLFLSYIGWILIEAGLIFFLYQKGLSLIYKNKQTSHE